MNPRPKSSARDAEPGSAQGPSHDALMPRPANGTAPGAVPLSPVSEAQRKPEWIAQGVLGSIGGKAG